MIELNIIEKAEVPAAWLDQFKAYAAIADDSQDSLLHAILTKAVLSVQQKADRSLIACTFELIEDDVEGNAVRLYQTVSQVLSVTHGGNGVAYSFVGRKVHVAYSPVTVTYKTEPHLADIDTLLPIVYQYATALYDGQDSKTLANILTQCH
jgi:hypothetical protein